MSTAADAMARAIAHHRAGRLAQAAAIYDRVLDRAPSHPDALHLSGVIAAQRGDPATAISRITEAVGQGPRRPDLHLNLGHACLQAGRLAEAREQYRLVLDLDGAHVDALHQLGLLLGRGPHRAEAMPLLERAAALRPGSARIHNDLGGLHLAANRLDEAERCFRRALSCDPAHAAAHSNLGVVMQRRGDIDAALASFRAAIHHDPGMAEAHNNVGNILAGQYRHEPAIAAYRRAVALRRDFYEAHHHLGMALREVGRLDEAEASYKRALALRPDAVSTLASLAHLHQQAGRFEEGIATCRRAIELDDRCVTAYVHLFKMDPASATDRALARVEALLEDSGLDARDRVHLHFALGWLYDGRDRHDEAFEHFRTGNGLKPDHYVPARHEAYVDGLIETFDRDFFASHGGGVQSDLPVFIVGMPRSGTTLVEQILDSHTRVHGAGELADMRDLARRLPGELAASATFPRVASELDPACTERLGRACLAALARRDPSAGRVVDKMPDNFHMLGLIAVLLPGARIIHVRRHPLDVCLSCFFQEFRALDFTLSFAGLGTYHRNYERLMAHWRDVLPVPVHEVQYERLVADPEGTVRPLLAFCGLDWEEGCLRFHENERPVRTASLVQVRRPIYGSAVARWRRYETHLGPLKTALGLPDAAAG